MLRPGRARELIAKENIDHIFVRIAEESRYKNARRLVKLVDSTKQVPRLGGGGGSGGGDQS